MGLSVGPNVVLDAGSLLALATSAALSCLSGQRAGKWGTLNLSEISCLNVRFIAEMHPPCKYNPHMSPRRFNSMYFIFLYFGAQNGSIMGGHLAHI